MTSTRITRRSTPVCIDGLYIVSLGELRTALPSDSARARLVVSDLSLGAWVGHQIARDFAVQLGLPPHQHIHPLIRTQHDPEDLAAHSDTIGRLIDAESSGDSVVLSALDLAEKVLAALAAGQPATLVVLAPRFGHPWEPENEMFVEFLLWGLAGTPSRLLLACASPQPPALPRRWSVTWLNDPPPAPASAPRAGLWALVPGLLAPDLAERLLDLDEPGATTYLRLADGHILVGPEYRRDPALVAAAEYERLLDQAEAPDWLRAYAYLHGVSHPAASTILRGQASQRFAEGGHTIALRLLEYTTLHARGPLEHAVGLLQLQSMRIALMRFAEAGEVPDVQSDLPAGLRGVLLQCKAWGLVMTGRSIQAEPYFQQARELLRDYEQSRFYLYLLNIAALNKLRLGLAEEALALEQTIERQLTAAQQPDWHLTYINSINQARLYRLTGQFELAERYYQRAFATNSGLRSDSDLVYIDVCLAHLNEQRGLPGAAFINWLRAALYYVSTPTPEALASRVARAILEQAPPSSAAFPEAIAQTLVARLEVTAQAAAISMTAFEQLASKTRPAERLPVFARTNDALAGHIERAFGSPGWSLMGMAELALPPAYTGPHYDRLRTLLVGLAGELCPALAAAPLTTLLVDTSYGCAMPSQPHELLYACVRLRVPQIFFAGKQLSLNPDIIDGLERGAFVRLADGPGYASYTGTALRIHFKRYREPITLSEQQSRILEVLDTGTTVADLLDRCAVIAPANVVLAELRLLERLRVLAIEPPTPR